MPPFYLRKAMELFILYTKNYQALCKEYFGAWMDTLHFETAEEEFANNQRLTKALNEYRELLVPLDLLWPVYQSPSEVDAERYFKLI